MANTVVSAGQLVTAAKGGEITSGTTAPASPTTGWLWLDENYSPPVLRVWTGQDWINTQQHDYRLFGTIPLHAITLPKLTTTTLLVFDNINLAADQSFRMLAWGGAIGSTFSMSIVINAESPIALLSSQALQDGWVLDLELNPSRIGMATLYGYTTSLWTQQINQVATQVNKVSITGLIDGSATSKLSVYAAAYIRH